MSAPTGGQFRVPNVSTGHLPDPELVTALVVEAYNTFKLNTEGKNSTVYPAMERVRSDLFGICVVGVNGNAYEIGDTAHEFTIMSVSKPFIFALVAEALGVQEVRDKIGANATGMAFNSVAAVERSADGRTNPMVNSGAIATTSLVPGGDVESRWKFIYDGLCAFAGRALVLDEETLESARATNHRNQGIARVLQSAGRIYLDPAEAVDLYTKQCCLNVSAHDLAVMGATLAVMATAGLYETSGDWLFDVGLLGKSGIGGGIVTVSPGKGGLGTFAPLLDAAGNSVKGQLVARFLSQELGMDLFVSKPE